MASSARDFHGGRDLRHSVLPFGPGAGDSKRIVEETSNGSFFNYSDASIDMIKQKVRSLYSDFKQGITADNSEVYKYSRESLTKNLVNLMDELTS